MEPMSVHVTEMLQRLSNRIDTSSIELSQLRDHVDNGFRHFEGRVNRSRETENFLREEQVRSERTREMMNMMPNDVKPAKIKSNATTKIDELRNKFQHVREFLRYHNGITILKNKEECIGYMVFWKAHYRSGGTPKLHILEMKSVGDFPEFLRWRNT
jgi:hypothetical protein